jgi:hypothetical protein
MPNYAAQLDAVNLAKQKLEAKQMVLLQKALTSESPNDIIKANQVLNLIENKKIGIEPKAFFIDPLQFNANLGYKDKMFSLTYTTLQRMAKTPIINSIIKTRKNQVADFAEPQEDKYSTGFVIRKKHRDGVLSEMTKQEKKQAYEIAEFLMRGGKESGWDVDDFDTFTKVAFVYPHAVASMKVGQGVKSEGSLVISGTKGYIYVPAPWWKTDYFEVRYENPANNRRYFYQLDGEGIRYMLVAFKKAIQTGLFVNYVGDDTSAAIVDVINDFYHKKDTIII